MEYSSKLRLSRRLQAPVGRPEIPWSGYGTFGQLREHTTTLVSEVVGIALKVLQAGTKATLLGEVSLTTASYAHIVSYMVIEFPGYVPMKMLWMIDKAVQVIGLWSSGVTWVVILKKMIVAKIIVKMVANLLFRAVCLSVGADIYMSAAIGQWSSACTVKVLFVVVFSISLLHAVGCTEVCLPGDHPRRH